MEPLIRELRKDEFARMFASILSEIVLITGLKTPVIYKRDQEGKQVEDARPFAELFTSFLRTHHSDLSCAEVKLAFRLNASGDLPGMANGKETDKIDFYGPNLTLDQIGGVLYRYRQKRANLARKLHEKEPVLLDAPPPTKEEQEMNDKQTANEYYRKYLNKEFSTVSLQYAHWIYDILDKAKLIRFSNEQKKVFLEEAHAIRQRELTIPRTDIQEHRQMNRLLEAYLNDAVPDPERRLVINIAKRLALIAQFRKWEEQGKKIIFE